MKKSIILLLITLVLVFGYTSNTCVNDCATCDSDTSQCFTCKGPFQKVEPSLSLACVCADNYYAIGLNPLQCAPIVSGQELAACQSDMALNISNIQVDTSCYYYTDTNVSAGTEKNYVMSQISIDTTHSQFNANSCRQYMYSFIQYSPVGYDSGDPELDYVLLVNLNDSNNPYYTALPGGNPGDQQIKILLIDVYSLAHVQLISDDGSQIIQELYFRIVFGTTKTILSANTWVSYVFTNRNEVLMMDIQVGVAITNGCAPGQNCIIITDLDVQGNVYKSDWTTVATSQTYTVGDSAYFRIWFKDASYKKQLQFSKLFYKNDKGQIFDYSSLTDATQTVWNHNDKSLHVKLALIDPSQNAVIQINMLISTLTQRFLRKLSDTSASDASTSNASTSDTSTSGNSSSSTTTTTTTSSSSTTPTTTSSTTSTTSTSSGQSATTPTLVTQQFTITVNSNPTNSTSSQSSLKKPAKSNTKTLAYSLIHIITVILLLIC